MNRIVKIAVITIEGMEMLSHPGKMYVTQK